MAVKFWTEEEVKILRKFFVRYGAEYVAGKLNCPVKCVRYKAFRIGLRKGKPKNWAKWEINYLIRHKDDRTYASIARTLKRTKNAVQVKVEKLGLTDKVSPWTESEKARFRELYADKSISVLEIAARLNKTFGSVNSQARALKLRRYPPAWSEKEHKYLLKNYKNKSSKELAKALGRSVDAVELYANRNGIFKREHPRPWSEEEIEFVRNNYKLKTYEEIGLILGRTKKAAQRIAKKLGLTGMENMSKPAAIEARKRKYKEWREKRNVKAEPIFLNR